jgi:hypothetical protein
VGRNVFLCRDCLGEIFVATAELVDCGRDCFFGFGNLPHQQEDRLTEDSRSYGSGCGGRRIS